MPATIIPLPATRPHDPAFDAALAELLRIGLTVARLAGRLAEVENAALDALVDTAADAAHALATSPGSLEEALCTGRAADASEAARTAAIARIAAITDCFEKAARAVRRTVALHARLATGRPFQPIPPPAAVPPRRAPSATRPAPRPATDAEHPDRPESGDELEARPDEEVLRGIHHDLSAATMAIATPESRRVGFSPPPRTPTAPDPGPAHQPGPALSFGPPPDPPSAPDT